MQQISSLITVFAIIAVFSARIFVESHNSGHWWPALGTLFGWAFAFFFVFHTALYLILLLVRGRDGISSYTTTKANCLSALVTICATVIMV
ncbi:hypothetical protein G6L28_09735 [Agrobacterium larrymoorei]|uniref:hypothetical protein n=1 Tax=Agrobacterium larrymoorei TaxID=160699 RepID=UPI001573FB48|nr:hypothetical protein [Agrobacterium larrymoorei]NTJ42873.1 hypothetical protein [Agrobacterium larrymoorei]